MQFLGKHSKNSVSGSCAVLSGFYAVTIVCFWMISGALYEVAGVTPSMCHIYMY
jgi:hypothetical protein